MVKETVKLNDGTEKEIEVHSIGVLTADAILDKHLKLNGIKQSSDMQEMDLKGSSLMLIRGEFLSKGIKGIDNVDDIYYEDADRIYKKYFEKILNLAMSGMGGNPN